MSEFLREYLPRIYRWCAACGDRPVLTAQTVLCRKCYGELEHDLEALCRS